MIVAGYIKFVMMNYPYTVCVMLFEMTVLTRRATTFINLQTRRDATENENMAYMEDEKWRDLKVYWKLETLES